jgi:hypothetical protein
MPSSGERFYLAARSRFEGLTRGEWLAEIPEQTEGVSLLPDFMPMLVTFTDIRDPGTATIVDPTYLAATFCRGYALKEAWLEVTEEPATYGRAEFCCLRRFSSGGLSCARAYLRVSKARQNWSAFITGDTVVGFIEMTRNDVWLF